MTPQHLTPRCWNCEYELTGLGVDDNCPECGTPVWSKPPMSRALNEATKTASTAQLWGILSLVFFFGCLGPLAAFITIPAFVYARKAETSIRRGLVNRDQIRGIKSARVCSWITISLTILSVGFYALVLFGIMYW